MKINDVTKIYGVYDRRPLSGQPAKKASAPAGKDKLMLSRDAIDFQSVMKGLKSAPDARAGKIEELSAKYAAGEHLADSRELAEALYKSGTMGKTIINHE